MKGIRYYYTACLPPAYRKGGRSSSLIGSQFFWAAWNGGSGVEKACEIMGSPRTRPGPLRRSRGRSREHLPPSTLGPNQRASPNMPPTLDAERGAETICGANLSLRGKSREAREYRLAYIGAPALTSPSRGVPWRREIARLLHAASDCYSARVIRGPETGGCILEGRREGCGRFLCIFRRWRGDTEDKKLHLPSRSMRGGINRRALGEDRGSRSGDKQGGRGRDEDHFSAICIWEKGEKEGLFILRKSSGRKTAEEGKEEERLSFPLHLLRSREEMCIWTDELRGGRPNGRSG